MAASLDLGDLRFLLVDLSAKADAGDEDAAIRLNLLALQCTPEVALTAAGMAAASAPLKRSQADCAGDKMGEPLLDIVLKLEPMPGGDAVSVEVEHYRKLAIASLASVIADGAGIPWLTAHQTICDLPGENLHLLDSHFGWSLMADLVAERLGTLDYANPIIPLEVN